ncbi:MAG: hypothetical protein QM736_14525 [Vicinamibacterales bacterium]
MQKLMRHLARKTPAFGESDHMVGSSVALPAGDFKRLEVRGPENVGAVFEGDRIAGRLTVRFTRTERPGIYRVVGTDQTGSTHPRRRARVRGDVDAKGSDLTRAAPKSCSASGTGAGGLPADASPRIGAVARARSGAAPAAVDRGLPRST